MADQTIDELNIRVAADSNSAANALENLIQKLERMQAPVAALTRSNSGLDKLAKTLEKLSAAAQAAQGLDNLDKVTNAVNALQALGTLNGAADVSSYVKAIKKLGDSRDSINAIAQFPDISPQVSSLISALRQFEGVQNLNINSLINSVGKLPELVSKINSMPAVDTSRITQLREMLSSFQGISDRNVVSFINALNKLPDVANRLQNIDLGRFRQQIERLVSSLEPLTRLLQQNSAELQAFAAVINATRVSGNAARGVEGLNTALGNLRVGTLLNVATLRKLVDVLSDCFNISSQFIENLNLFRVTMGDSTDEAYAFAEAVNDALGVDVSDWIKYQGFFQSVAKGFGLTAQKADLMSKNLTQLSYDISSFYNLSVDTAYTKVQAGISGELEPLRRLGFALDQATLKQVAYNHGITQSFESMTQAQKAQIRYVAMIEQASNIGVLGDMSRTIDSASNNMRVLTARIQQLGRAVGNILLPILSAILPYLTAFVQILTEAAQYIANLFGYELPQFDFSGITAEYDDIADSANEATKATEKFKGSLAGVDQLNIIGSHTNSGSGTDEGVTDWDLNLPSYDFLNGVESRTKEIVDKMKRWIQELMPWIEGVGAAVAAIFVADKVRRFADQLKEIPKLMQGLGKTFGVAGAEKFLTIAGGLAAGAASAVLFYNSIKRLITKTGNFANNIGMLAAAVTVAGSAIAAFILLGNPLGAVITGVVAAVGLIAGVASGIIEANKAFEENQKILAEQEVYAERGGIAIEGLADGFSAYFDSITNHYDDILENTTAFRNNIDAVNDAATSIYNLTDKYIYLGENMTAEDAQKLADNLEIIAKGVSDSLGIGTQGIITALKDKFHDFAVSLGYDVDDMVGKFYLLESMGNTAIATLKQEADTIVTKVISGTATSDDLSNLNDIVAKMATPNVGTESQINFQRALEQMSSATIDFTSPEAVQNAISTVQTAADQAYSSINSAWNAQILELNQMKAQYENLGVDIEFDSMFGAGAFDTLFNNTRTALDTGFEAQINEIKSSVGVYAGMLYSELNSAVDEAAKKAEPSLGDRVDAGFSLFQAKGLLYGPSDVDTTTKLKAENRIKETFSEQFAAIENFANEYGADYKRTGAQIGQYLLEGMQNGTIANQTDLNNTLAAAASGGVKAVEETLGINSPSKVFYEIGDYCMQGMINGISEKQSALMTCVDGIAVAVIMKMAEIKQAFDFSDISSTTAQDLNSELAFRPKINSSGFSGRGYAREAVEDSVYNVTSAIQNSGEYTFNLHTTVDLDGDTVGESVTRYQNNLVYTSGGRN